MTREQCFPLNIIMSFSRPQNSRDLQSFSQERRKDRDEEEDDCDDYVKFESESDKSPSETGTYTVDKDDKTPSLQVSQEGIGRLIIYDIRSRDSPAWRGTRPATWRSGPLNTPSQSPGTCHSNQIYPLNETQNPVLGLINSQEI